MVMVELSEIKHIPVFSLTMMTSSTIMNCTLTKVLQAISKELKIAHTYSGKILGQEGESETCHEVQSVS